MDLADVVQGRDRSSPSELRTLDSFDARFHFSQDTLSRRRRLFDFQGAILGSARPLTDSLLVRGKGESTVDSVERKGFEPSTPGLQSRCSPS